LQEEAYSYTVIMAATVTLNSLRALKAAFDDEKKRKEEEFKRAAEEAMNKVVRVEVDKIKEKIVNLATKGYDQAVIPMENVSYNSVVISTLRKELEGVSINVYEEDREAGNCRWSVMKNITISWA
jgi:hypothetical protein